MAKENANPQIYQVEEKRASTRRTPLDWSQLGTFGSITDENDMEDVLATLPKSIGKQDAIIPTSSSDKAILQALVDCRQATNGKGVHLLRQAGLDIPISMHSKLIAGSGPIFQLAAETTASIPSDISLQEGVSTVATPQIKKKRKAQSDDALTVGEVFDIIRNIQDPEHPHTLEQLGVVSLEQVELLETISSSNSTMVNVRFTPTIPHCSMATLIGLCIRVKLWRSLPPSGKFKVNVQIEPGTHVSENAINKQLRDKERVCAALENKHLANVVNKCIRDGMNGVRFAGNSGRCDSAWLFASVSLEEGDVHVLRGDRSFTLYYRIFNPRSTKTPLVVCHGGPSLPSQYLYPLVELLDARPIVFFDQLGCGKSDEPKDLLCYSISQSVEDLKEVIWQVVAPNHTSFHLYGHSFGGVLAYEYLSFCLSDDRHAQYSQKSALPTCRSVMLSNTPNDLGRCNRDYDRMYAKNPLLFWQQHVCRVGTPPPLQDAMKHMGTVWTGMDVVAGYREAPLPHKKENDEMIPLLVISCTRDFAFDTSNGNVWVSLLSQNSSGHREFVTLENAAHYPFYENKTAYGEILCEFLSHVELQLSKR